MRYVRRGKIADEKTVRDVCNAFSLEPAFARLLISRGLENIADIDEFLHPNESQLCDPFLFKNMAAVCHRIKTAIENKEKIAVYADYDADGICSCAILLSALKENGADAHPYIPDRKTEGYGTNEKAIRMICEKGFSLIISVDCGIRSVGDVAVAKSYGTDFIILDHHETGDLPDTPYIIDPKDENESYPNNNLCGAGVVFKTVFALFGKSMMKYIDLAGIATIGDVVSLTGENRAIAYLGIEKLNKNPNPGIAELLKAAGIENVKSRAISFGIVPRLNASGRMSHAKYALEMLITKDAEKRKKLALWLNEINAKRQTMQTEIFEEAEIQIRENERFYTPSVIVAEKEGWEHGLVGLAASKLTEKFNRPSIVFTENEGLLTGSARSIEGINIYDILNSANHLYERFGGHSQAAGLSLLKENLIEAIAIWNKKITELYPDSAFERGIVYDEELLPSDLSEELERELYMLEPVGEGNPEPVFMFKNITLERSIPLGGGKHYKAIMEGTDIEVIRFGVPEPMPNNAELNIVGSFSVNDFRGKKTKQINVQSLKRCNPAKHGINAFIASSISELTAYMETSMPEEEADGFFGILKDCLNKSPLGTAIFINSAIGEEAYNDMLTKENPKFAPISFTGIDLNGADNALISGNSRGLDLKNYRDVFLIGAYSAVQRLSESGFSGNIHLLKLDYSSFASELLIDKTGLYSLAEKLFSSDISEKDFSGMKELTFEVLKLDDSLTLSKVWFAVAVFSELGLIKFRQSERIVVQYNTILHGQGEGLFEGSRLYGIVLGIARGKRERILF